MKVVAPLAVSLVSLVTLAGPRVAQADAPGETEPMAVPACAVVVPQPSVMANRWAVGFAIGSESLAPSGGGGDAQTQFAVGELAIRYRATLHLELEAEAGGGRQQLANNGGQGDLQLSSAGIAARYRFRPERAWNWYVSAGVGETSVASAEASRDLRSAASRGHVQLGIGLERRFAHLALSAELRAIGVAGESSSTAVMPQSTTVSMPAAPASTGESGGLLVIGASYYF